MPTKLTGIKGWLSLLFMDISFSEYNRSFVHRVKLNLYSYIQKYADWLIRNHVQTYTMFWIYSCSIAVYNCKLLHFTKCHDDFSISPSLRAGLQALPSWLVKPRAWVARFGLGLSNFQAESSPSQAPSIPSWASSLELNVHPYGCPYFGDCQTGRRTTAGCSYWLSLASSATRWRKTSFCCSPPGTVTMMSGTNDGWLLLVNPRHWCMTLVAQPPLTLRLVSSLTDCMVPFFCMCVCLPRTLPTL